MFSDCSTLAATALIREREHGTIEHLLVMPVTPFEIMVSKVWSMGLVVIIASAFSIPLIIQGLLAIPIAGSVPLFLAGTALFLLATSSHCRRLAQQQRRARGKN